MDFTPAGNLQLIGADGKLASSTNTSVLSVIDLNISDGGNFTLLDDKDNVVWQSFDHPTKTWLPTQTNLFWLVQYPINSVAVGRYFLFVTNDGIDAFIGSDTPPPPRKVSSRPYQSLYLSHTALGNSGSIEALSNYARFNIENYTVDGFRYIVLQPSGHLNVNRLNKVNSIFFNLVLPGILLIN